MQEIIKMWNKNILLINKPKHWTSNDVVQKIKKMFGFKKVGHGGTLDPLATGLLILGVNEGTKQLNNLLQSSKTYRAIIHFNYYTTTYDNEGDVIQYCYKDISINDITKALDHLINCEYYQYPPKYSAIKINGQKAYDLARNNVTFTIQPKLVKLIKYNIISYQYNELVMDLEVSKGFYIRSLAYDLGLLVNNFANLAVLTRIKIGDYSLQDAHRIEELNDLLHKK